MDQMFTKIKSLPEIKEPSFKIHIKQKKKEMNNCNIIKLFTIFLFLVIIIILKNCKIIEQKAKIRNSFEKNNIEKDNIFLDQFETDIYNKIREKLTNTTCSQMWSNQREFLNGVIRKFRPKKIVEVGTAQGGASIVILNAIQDIENSHLFSIDLDISNNVGSCVRNYFPEFLNKWTLFQGDVAAKFIEHIGNNIDMLFIDSAHLEPGEILDFLIVLPFLKENAIVGFHDIGNQITVSQQRQEWAPYIIFNMIRGKKYLPSGHKQLRHDIGIRILDSNQKKYFNDYFRSLGGQWQYFPKEKHISLIYEYLKKYYDDDCLLMFNETVEFNREFVKKNPMGVIYSYTKER